MNGNGAHVTDGGVWTNGSSRTFKTDFQAIDGQEVLDKLAGLSITDWRYKGEDASRTSGPVAEDFSEAFGLGGDEKYIGTVDADGVTMAAVQALYELVKQQQKRSTCSKRSSNNREMAPIMRKPLLASFALLCVLYCSTPESHKFRWPVNFQGVLLDDNGDARPDGSYELTVLSIQS